MANEARHPIPLIVGHSRPRSYGSGITVVATSDRMIDLDWREAEE